MKYIVLFLTGLFLFAFTTNLFAQKGDITLILLRHAEKDVSPGASKTDPELSAEGKQRAERLVETIKKYKPTQIYATGFKRTRSTVAPLADSLDPKYRIQVQGYDHNEIDELAEKLLKNETGTIVVAGHNTTTPTLANLLVKSEKYQFLHESEYDKIWIIKIKKNKIRDEVIKY
jgi:phosphohistidine phosphatase SixA